MNQLPYIARVRELITAGMSDVEIASRLAAESKSDAPPGWDNPRTTFRCLDMTMRRALTENRAVAAREVLVQLELFRHMWEEAAASGDAREAQSVVLQGLAPVLQASSVSEAYQQLHADMSVLSVRAQALPPGPEREARLVAESRYRRKVGSHPVTCCAQAGAAVAHVNNVLFQALGHREAYRAIFTDEVLQPVAPLLLVHRPTWTELLARPLPALVPA